MKSDFRELNIWKRGRELRLKIEEFVCQLPKEEKYRLGDQMIRSARSVTALIAEGYGRYHYQETVQFCRQARGSLFELIDHLIVALDNHYLEESFFQQIEKEIESEIRDLNGYIRFLLQQKKKESIA